MNKETPMPLSDEFFALWVMVAQTKDSVLKARQRDYARFNISNERRAVLWVIQNNGGRSTPVEIARELFRELHSITEMLNRMEKEGLIKKYKTNGKSRAEFGLTRKGLEVFNQSLYNPTDEKIFSVLSKKQRERLMSYLWKIRNKALQELGIPEWSFKFPLDPNKANHSENNNADGNTTTVQFATNS